MTILAGLWDSDGLSHAEVDGIDVRVADAIPGERIDVEVTHRSPGGPVAWADRVPGGRGARDRRPAPCSLHARCGGCGIQHVRDEDQLPHKVESALGLAGLPDEIKAALAPPRDWIAGTSPWGHRHKVVFLPVRRGTTLRLGAYARRSNSVVALGRCEVLAPALDDLRERIERSLHKAIVRDAHALRLPGMPPGRDERGGALRAIVGRANRRGEVLLTFVVTDLTAGSWLEAPARGLIDGPGGVVGVSLAVHADNGDAILDSGEVQPLLGKDSLSERVGEVGIPLLPGSFFQVHPQVAELVTRRLATELVGSSGVLLDLYCGTGLLALTLGKALGMEVLGVDVDARAVAAAGEAARRQSIEGTFVAGSPSVVLDRALGDRRVDVAVVDPPRSGCRPADLAALLSRGPRILVMMSCHAPSLARDSVTVLAAGYAARLLLPADMMPQAPHLEWLVIFDRLDPAVAAPSD